MKSFAKPLVLLLSSIMLVLLCACAQEPAVSSTYSKTASSSQSTEGVSFLEFLQSNLPEDAHLLEDFNAENVQKLIAYKDNFQTIETDDPKAIEDVYQALLNIRVLGEYEDDTYVTDQAQSVKFEFKDGTGVRFMFDFGNFVLDKTYYKCRFSTSPYQAASFALDLN